MSEAGEGTGKNNPVSRREVIKMAGAAALGVVAGRIIGQENQKTQTLGDVHVEDTNRETEFKGKIDISSPLLRKDEAVKKAMSALMEGHLLVVKIILTQDSEVAQKMIGIMAKASIEGIRNIQERDIPKLLPSTAEELAKLIETTETAQV